MQTQAGTERLSILIWLLRLHMVWNDHQVVSTRLKLRGNAASLVVQASQNLKWQRAPAAGSTAEASPPQVKSFSLRTFLLWLVPIAEWRVAQLHHVCLVGVLARMMFAMTPRQILQPLCKSQRLLKFLKEVYVPDRYCQLRLEL